MIILICSDIIVFFVVVVKYEVTEIWFSSWVVIVAIALGVNGYDAENGFNFELWDSFFIKVQSKEFQPKKKVTFWY